METRLYRYSEVEELEKVHSNNAVNDEPPPFAFGRNRGSMTMPNASSSNSSITTTRLLRRAALLLALAGTAAAGSVVDAPSELRSGRDHSLRTPSPDITAPYSPVALRHAAQDERIGSPYPAVPGRSSQWEFKLTLDDVPSGASTQRKALRVHV